MMAYIFKSGLLLTLFYIFFILFMRRATFFHYNRIMLLFGTAICMLLPLVDIDVQTFANYMPRVVMPELHVSDSAHGSSFFALNRKFVFTAIYLSGIITVFVIMLGSLMKTYSVIRQGTLKREDDYKLIITDEDIPSFSFLHIIVINKNDYENCPVILKHEIAHISHRHTCDLLLFSIVTLVHWFNPLVWVVRSELMLLHEYEADDSVIRQGIDATQYQLLLVKKAVGTQRFQLANGFNHTKLKKRITMMQTTKTNKWARLGYLLCIPVLMCVLCLCTPKNTSDEQPVPFDQIEDKPQFNGQAATEFSKWVNAMVTYPESAKSAGIQGKVVLSFTVNAKGKVTDVKVVKGADESLNAEAVRVVSLSPDWTPGKKNGKNVPVTYIFPVIFALQ